MANYNLTVAASDDSGTSATERTLRPDSNGYLTYGPVDGTNYPVILGNKVYTAGDFTSAITPYSDTRILTNKSVTISSGTVNGIIVTIINTGTSQITLNINSGDVYLAAGEYFEYVWYEYKQDKRWIMINSRYAWWK